MNWVFILALCLISTNSFAENSYLVGNLGIVNPDTRGVLVSTPYIRKVPVTVVTKSKVYGKDLELSITGDYEGVPQTRESLERAGFYSIIEVEG